MSLLASCKQLQRLKTNTSFLKKWCSGNQIGIYSLLFLTAYLIVISRAVRCSRTEILRRLTLCNQFFIIKFRQQYNYPLSFISEHTKYYSVIYAKHHENELWKVCFSLPVSCYLVSTDLCKRWLSCRGARRTVIWSTRIQ